MVDEIIRKIICHLQKDKLTCTLKVYLPLFPISWQTEIFFGQHLYYCLAGLMHNIWDSFNSWKYTGANKIVKNRTWERLFMVYVLCLNWKENNVITHSKLVVQFIKWVACSVVPQGDTKSLSYRNWLTHMSDSLLKFWFQLLHKMIEQWRINSKIICEFPSPSAVRIMKQPWHGSEHLTCNQNIILFLGCHNNKKPSNNW